MSLRSILRELKEVKDGIGSISMCSRAKSHIAPDQTGPSLEIVQQSPWANLPPELLFDIIRRLEESENSWPARAVVVSCASVCKTWREITKEIVRTPEQCRRLTFPISLKQPGPRAFPINCFIKRDRASSTYLLYYGLVPSEIENDKVLLAARKVKRATRTEFTISLSANNFSRGSSTYCGKLRSGFLRTKFTIYDNKSPSCPQVQPSIISCRKYHSKQKSPRSPTCCYTVETVKYELNFLRTQGPRKMRCCMDSIPISSVFEGSTTQTSDEQTASQPTSKEEVLPIEDGSTGVAETSAISSKSVERPLVLKNKAPRWHEQLQCWCLNFKGRVTVASVKNFQLVADIDPSLDVPAEEQERVILQFGKIGKDIFTMDYCYPLSAFQAFAICISTFDTKPVCEG